MMKVFLNDEPRETLDDIKLSDFLNDLGINSLNGWAVALNEEVVPTDKLTHFVLSSNDRIILIQATQGG